MSGYDAADTIALRIEQARQTALQRRERWLSSRQGQIHVALTTLTAYLLLCLTVAVTLLVALCTLFRKRRFYTEVMARWLAETFLRVTQVKLVVLPERSLPQLQVMYVFNHPSTLDMFILLSLGLPDTRYFLSGEVRKIVPVGVIATLMGTFFTPPQTKPAARADCFRNAEEVLRRSGASVCLSPEGMRVTSGSIGAFNKGVFHLATNLKLPIVPLFIDIPPDVDPGKGWKAAPGTARLHILPPISTADWTLADLDKNRAKVRAVYLEFQRKLAVATLAGNPEQHGAGDTAGV